MAVDLQQYELPKPESTCRVVLGDGNPCAYPRFLYALCHAWYVTKSRPQIMSMREIFVEGLNEARADWNRMCPIEAKEMARRAERERPPPRKRPPPPEWYPEEE